MVWYGTVYGTVYGAGMQWATVSMYFHMASGSVASHMQRQVVGAAEAARAQLAAERLDARVLPVVAGQLIGARESPDAALPGAYVRLLTCEWEEHKRRD